MRQGLLDLAPTTSMYTPCQWGWVNVASPGHYSTEDIFTLSNSNRETGKINKSGQKPKKYNTPGDVKFINDSMFLFAA